MKNKTTKTIACVIAGLILSACGAGTDANNAPATQLESLLSRVNSSENIVASLEFSSLSPFSTSPQGVSIEDGDGQFISVINGRRYIFSRVDANTIATVSGSNGLARVNLFSNDPLHPDVPNDYILFTYGVFDEATQRASTGFFVTGIRTSLDAIPTTASASYNGRVVGFSYSFPISNIISESRVILNADINMDVNFSQRTISGRITNILDTDRMATIPSSAFMSLNQTSFARDGSYNGNLTMSLNLADALGVQNIHRANYRGATYGKNANALAGVFNVSGVGTDLNPFRAAGGFIADR